MGVDVAVCGANDEELAAIRALFEEWEGIFSRFRPDSELNRVNRHPLGVVILSRVFAYAAQTAISAAAATNGLVDPTLGAAVEAAGYDRDFSELEDDGRPLPFRPPSPGSWRSLRLSGRMLSRPPEPPSTSTAWSSRSRSTLRSS
jgi:thiamine biosynthesis lipoprotein